MKSRNHRHPIAETNDDWGDGSWTVDCVCGVNFDDGEEMVNCDECGVWVHTRCSRYVKSEKSFACDKCKSNSCRNNESEETEVAQLLVDLPNKTLRMDHLYPLSGPSVRPGKLYTEISTEKRVHVHGIPGGDPSLFAGLSSVFGPQLWKCTGYVPKKFSCRYKDFPSLDEKESEEVGRRNHDESDNTDENENTAGVLFSLLKETPAVTPFGSSEGGKCQLKDGTVDKEANFEHRNGVEKDSRLPHVAAFDSMKHKKERGTSKDRRDRKRIAIHDKGKDPKKKPRIASTTASTISSDGKQFEFYEDRGPKVIKVYTESSKSGDLRHPASVDQLSNGRGVRGINTSNDSKHVAADELDAETKKLSSSRCYTNSDGRLKEDNTGDERASEIENSHKVEVVSATIDSPNVNGGGSAQKKIAEFQKAESVVEQLAVASREVTDSKNSQGLIGGVSSSSEPNAGEKTEVDKNLDVHNVHHSPSTEEKSEGMKLSTQQVEVSAMNLSENVNKSDLVISSKEISDQVPDGDKSTAGGDYNKDSSWAGGRQSKPELPTEPGVRDCSSGHKSTSICSDGSLGARKSSSQLKPGKYAEGEGKSGTRISSSDQNHLKVLVGKSSSRTYKSSTSGSQSPRNVPSHSSSKQRGISNDNVSSRRDTGSSGVGKDEGRFERSKKIAKNTPESSISHASKISQSSRNSHAPVPKGNSSVPKEPSLHSSSKVLSPRATAVPSFAESNNSQKNAGPSNPHNKVVGSGLPEKSEKTSQHDSQPSSKVNASQMQPPVSSNHPSGLSDEELALLLHQQLNSSPRVPRVPRMRHAGSLPQLTSPTASMQVKRTSSSGGKDFNSSSRRKSKESGKDGALSVPVVSDEAKKGESVSSPDHRGQDLVKKNKPPASTATTSSGLSSSTEMNEYKLSSSRNSPRHASDGDSGAVGRPTPLTLPGLIAKIMSKGERMTLEELCNAVLPHWPHLRKHNGEPYAYSSHSNAVLDCLRNRTEWARLVDRGPKTSTSKKRRKSDADPSGAESDDSVRRERTAKDGRSKSLESQPEEFPKGKRKARKRRRLALHGRGIKDFRRRRRTEVVSDDEDGSPSNSSGDSESSKDEMQGDGTSGTNEASASSDETSN